MKGRIVTLLKRRIALIDGNDNFRALFSLLISNSDRYFFAGGISSFVNTDEGIFKSRPDIILIAQENSGLNTIEVIKQIDRKSTRLNSSHSTLSRMPSSA